MSDRERKRSAAWQAFRKIGSPRYWVAPMADSSVLPFRLLCKRHGAEIGVTPMIHAAIFAKDESFRKDAFDTCAEDAPVIAQLAGNDPVAMLETARLLEGRCAAIDVNLGCPQKIAKRGSYGVFLADDPALVADIVLKLTRTTSLPVFCKMRLRETIEETISFALMLQENGCSVLTVHGRKRDQVNLSKTDADWGAIAAVVDRLDIPVVANGSVRSFADIERCFQVTHAQAVMAGSALLSNPALFSGVAVPPIQMAEEFLALAHAHPVTGPVARGLLVKILLGTLQKHPDLREELVTSGSVEEMTAVIVELRKRDAAGSTVVLEGYDGQRPEWASGGAEADISLSPLPGFTLWRETLAFPRAPLSRGRLGDSGGWILLIGVGRRYLPPGSLKSLRESAKARAWQCRDCAVYLDVPDDSLYHTVSSAKRVSLFYRIRDPVPIAAASASASASTTTTMKPEDR